MTLEEESSSSDFPCELWVIDPQDGREFNLPYTLRSCYEFGGLSTAMLFLERKPKPPHAVFGSAQVSNANVTDRIVGEAHQNRMQGYRAMYEKSQLNLMVTNEIKVKNYNLLRRNVKYKLND